MSEFINSTVPLRRAAQAAPAVDAAPAPAAARTPAAAAKHTPKRA